MTPPRPAAGRRYDVVHVVEAFTAGVRRHLVDLLSGLQAIGERQALVYSAGRVDPARGAALETLAARGVALFEIPMAREISPARDAASAVALARLLRRLAPRVLHLHSSKAGGLGRIVAPLTPGRPLVVYTPHGSAANFGPRYELLERALGRIRTDRIIAVSGSEYEELRRRRFVDVARLRRVDSGLPVDEIRRHAASAPPPSLPGRQLVVVAARLSPPKDPCFLVEVATALAPRYPELHFAWAGDGELRPQVERAIAAAGLEGRFSLLGWLANPYPLLAAADVVALPSGFESFGYATLEAMVLGRPVVATDVTGSRDLVVTGVTGELVRVGDARAFAAAIAAVLDDPARAARLGAAAQARAAAHYTADRMAAETRAVYEAALAGPAARTTPTAA